MNAARFALIPLIMYLAIAGMAWAADPPSTQPKMVAARPAALEQEFVVLKRHVPLMPGSLNLFGYETTKQAESYPVLSPDKTQMAVTELFFLPNRHQTYSRVVVFPVGREPSLDEVLSADARARVEAEKQQYPTTDPAFTPSVSLDEVNPRPFWNRYQPKNYPTQRQTIFEAGFDSNTPFRFDAIQIIDWSADGSKLLIKLQPGFHHLGIRRTLPVLYDVPRSETIRLIMLPNLIWQDFIRQIPEWQFERNRIWDIRPLGWSHQDSQAIIVKLVVFEGQSEVSAGFWSYGTQSGQLQYLGATLSPEMVAQNGWLVSLRDPNAPGGPKTYAPGETPPPTEAPQETLPPKRSWRDRIQFWKKQR